MHNYYKIFIVLVLLCGSGQIFAQQRAVHPNLILTGEGVQEIKAALGNLSLLDRKVAELEKSVNERLSQPVEVPVPKDAGGGYTHEVHKENYRTMYEAGVLYQLSGDTRYADYVKNVLLQYADLYPGLSLHPAGKEQSPGKLFWQSLNECVWLVYSIQAYDAVKPYLSNEEVHKIEMNLFREVAHFLSEGSAATFNKIHNHGTWAVAAVGMTGYVLNEQELVEKALYSLQKNGKGGFLAQLDQLFSPDGYYTEGPYYQRYALMPFVVFARAIENNEPERKIFEYRDGIILKAIHTAIQLTYDGKFLPFNDALKEKDLRTVELVYATNIAYAITGDNSLLDIADYQQDIILSEEGLAVARRLHEGKKEPYPFISKEFTDGTLGEDGAVGILRSGMGNGHQALVMKYTSQGMGHGHYDKLHWMFYDNHLEIVQDYGAARFLNIEAKEGGHYLPENTSWAKQTISHNTVVVDEESHFRGDYELAMQKSPDSRFFELPGGGMQIMSAEIEEVYPGVNFMRTMAMVDDETFGYPIVIDVFELMSEESHQYDLPLYFQGHIMDSNMEPVKTDKLEPLGQQNGYQHLWLLGRGKPTKGQARITWLSGNRFYTYTTLADANTEVLFTHIGANDPSFNLRNEPGLIIRQQGAADHTFVSVLEPHGEFNAKDEYTRQSATQIRSLKLERRGNELLVLIETKAGERRVLGLSRELSAETAHSLELDSEQINWKGPYGYRKIGAVAEARAKDGK